MKIKKTIGMSLIAASAAITIVSAPAVADTSALGIAVGAVGSTTPVGLATTNDAALGGAGSIRYFIPLSNGGGGTYGVGGLCGGNGAGTCADSGNGSPTLHMILEFTPVSTSSASTLTVKFRDLDVIGASDPSGFLESLDVLKYNGAVATSITGGPILSLGPYISGDDNLQTLSLNLGVLTASPLYLDLSFRAFAAFNGTNTEELLRATVTSVSAVPGPLVGAGLPGFIAAFGALIALARRRRAAATLA